MCMCGYTHMCYRGLEKVLEEVQVLHNISSKGCEKGKGKSLLYVKCCITWASLVAQSVKNLPAMRKTWTRSLGWEDLREKGMATHSSILAWSIPKGREAWWATVHGAAEELHTT